MKKSILITGVSTGIGYELSKIFVSRGYHVFGSVRKQQDAEKLLKEIGSDYTPLIMDVTQTDEIENAASLVSKALNGKTLTGLINNAGIATTGALATISMEEYRYQFEVNFFGVVSVIKHFLPLLGTDKARNGVKGKIINISSNAGQLGFPFLGPYCSSKHALEGMSQSLRRELLLYGIDVIIIGPAAIKTPIWEKDSATTIPKSAQGTDYEKSMGIFQNIFRKEGERGMESKKLADKIFTIFEKKNPKTRYALASRKFAEWIAPRYLIPNRMMDNMMRKIFK